MIYFECTTSGHFLDPQSDKLVVNHEQIKTTKEKNKFVPTSRIAVWPVMYTKHK